MLLSLCCSNWPACCGGDLLQATGPAWPHGATSPQFASSLKKGDPVLVQGELRTGEYTDKKKVTRQRVEIFAQTILRIDYTKLGVARRARGLTATRDGLKNPPA
jgi:single-stranded DNA-binding protein